MKAEPARFVLDSFALLAHLQSESGGPRVKAVLAEADQERAEVYLCLINHGEVVYIVEREKGLTAAQHVTASVDSLPITVVEPDRRLTFAAAHLKAGHPISYPDALALALAQDMQATLLTGDPEFREVESLVSIERLPEA